MQKYLSLMNRNQSSSFNANGELQDLQSWFFLNRKLDFLKTDWFLNEHYFSHIKLSQKNVISLLYSFFLLKVMILFYNQLVLKNWLNWINSIDWKTKINQLIFHKTNYFNKLIFKNNWLQNLDKDIFEKGNSLVKTSLKILKLIPTSTDLHSQSKLASSIHMVAWVLT